MTLKSACELLILSRDKGNMVDFWRAVGLITSHVNDQGLRKIRLYCDCGYNILIETDATIIYCSECGSLLYQR